MKRLIMFAIMAALASVSVAPAVLAQQAQQLELRHPRRPTVVLPEVPPDTVRADAEAARREIEGRARVKEATGEAREPLRRRPDLSYDVVSGIQSRGVNDALRRR
jgi:hypothetical protein